MIQNHQKSTMSSPDQKQKVQFEHDELYLAYAAKDEEWHRRMTRRVMRKVDWHLLPLLVLMYLLNFLDRKYVSC